MVKCMEILKQRAMGISIRNISFSCKCSTAAVATVVNGAKARAGPQRRPFLEDIYEMLTSFQLVYSEPACPCGYYGGSKAGRTCNAYCVRTYRDRLLDIAEKIGCVVLRV